MAHIRALSAGRFVEGLPHTMFDVFYSVYLVTPMWVSFFLKPLLIPNPYLTPNNYFWVLPFLLSM